VAGRRGGSGVWEVGGLAEAIRVTSAGEWSLVATPMSPTMK